MSEDRIRIKISSSNSKRNREKGGGERKERKKYLYAEDFVNVICGISNLLDIC